MACFRRFWINPFRAPEPLPILNPSNFVPKNGFRVVKALRSPVIGGSTVSSQKVVYTLLYLYIVARVDWADERYDDDGRKASIFVLFSPRYLSHLESSVSLSSKYNSLTRKTDLAKSKHEEKEKCLPPLKKSHLCMALVGTQRIKNTIQKMKKNGVFYFPTLYGLKSPVFHRKTEKISAEKGLLLHNIAARIRLMYIWKHMKRGTGHLEARLKRANALDCESNLLTVKADARRTCMKIRGIVKADTRRT